MATVRGNVGARSGAADANRARGSVRSGRSPALARDTAVFRARVGIRAMRVVEAGTCGRTTLVGQPVAVVVEPVAIDLGGRGADPWPARGSVADRGSRASARGGAARAPTRAAGETVVADRVAVVVDPVARLGNAGSPGDAGLSAVGADRAVAAARAAGHGNVVLVGRAVAILVHPVAGRIARCRRRPGPAGHRSAAAGFGASAPSVAAGGRRGPVLVRGTVAVGVDAVAGRLVRPFAGNATRFAAGRRQAVEIRPPRIARHVAVSQDAGRRRMQPRGACGATCAAVHRVKIEVEILVGQPVAIVVGGVAELRNAGRAVRIGGIRPPIAVVIGVVPAARARNLGRRDPDTRVFAAVERVGVGIHPARRASKFTHAGPTEPRGVGWPAGEVAFPAVVRVRLRIDAVRAAPDLSGRAAGIDVRLARCVLALPSLRLVRHGPPVVLRVAVPGRDVGGVRIVSRGHAVRVPRSAPVVARAGAESRRDDEQSEGNNEAMHGDPFLCAAGRPSYGNEAGSDAGHSQGSTKLVTLRKSSPLGNSQTISERIA